MKKTLFLVVLISSFVNAQIVSIPDVNFKAKLLSASSNNQIASTEIPDEYGNVNSYVSIDINGDGQIQVNEAAAIKYLDISYTNIVDMTGINSFTSLKSFNCNANQITFLSINNLTDLLFFQCLGNHSLTSLDLSSLINVQKVYCDNNSNLSSLNVSGLSNLNVLTCEYNSLTSININNTPNLIKLRCSNNELTSLNVANLSNLELLLCSSNQISNLNVTGLVNLQDFSCDGNLLTSIDVSNCLNLVYFGCSANQLTSVNVNNLTSLVMFNCSSNLLTSLNFSSVPSLMYLSCSNNQLTTLNLSNLPNLQDLTCNNNSLTVLDMNNNVNLNNVNFMTNPLEIVLMKNGSFQSYPTGIETGTGYIDVPNTPVQFICADEFETNYWQSIFQNIIVATTYCSFTPGGDFNTITGIMIVDVNNNGCDAFDLPHPSIKININDGTSEGSTFTNNSGSYNFYTEAGNFVLAPSIENSAWFNFSPAAAAITFPDNNNNTFTQNFCINANGVHPDLEIVIAPIIQARPGFDAMYQIVYKNKGNQTLTGNLNFNFNDSVLDFVSSIIIPDSQATGNLSWNYSNLLPFESRSINVVLNVNSPTETPAVNIGDTLSFSSNINPVSGDENPLDNSFAMNQVVVGSYDPNDKTCLEGTNISPTKIGDYLHYNINFENTGTVAATFIVVKDEIDTTKFDISSLQVMNSSHSMYARITGNKVEFIFENINLGANQYGNVVFKIKTKNTLVTGTTVTNNANIYFDYNFPITTNTASTTFQTLSNTVHTLDNSISVFPNPTSSFLTITSEFIIKSIELFDVQGRVLQYNSHNDTSMILDVSDKSNGIYFVKISSDKGSKVQKIIKE